MAGARRLAKRSIVGTRVAAQWQDGRFYPGVIQTQLSDSSFKPSSVFTILFDEGYSKNFKSREIVGPGFQSSSNFQLKHGQKIYITLHGREVKATVQHHDHPHGDILVCATLPNGREVNVYKKPDEIRLLESRKSARLMDHHDTDYSRVVDSQPATNPAFSQVIDVPNSQRRRHDSDDDMAMDDDSTDDVMDETAAAMVLTNLSCSPTSPHFPFSHEKEDLFPRSDGQLSSSHTSSGFMSGHSDRSDPSPPLAPHLTDPSPSTHFHSNSAPLTHFHGSSTYPTPAIQTQLKSPSTNQFHYESSLNTKRDLPSTPLTQFHIDSASPTTQFHPRSAPMTQFYGDTSSLTQFRGDSASATHLPTNRMDEGVDTREDLGKLDSVTKGATRTMYKCTWRLCDKVYSTCEAVEQHVRTAHLGIIEEEDTLDGEEEFYYTEIEVTVDTVAQTLSNITMSEETEALSLSDHDYQKKKSSHVTSSSVPTGGFLSSYDLSSVSIPIDMPQLQRSLSWQNTTFNISPLQRFIARPSNDRLHQHQAQSPKSLIFLSPLKASAPHKKPRGDVRKCRKLYGMDNRDMWCTQCKWKKACSRFFE